METVREVRLLILVDHLFGANPANLDRIRGRSPLEQPRPTNCCCESATLMLKRKLRIVKRTPPAIGVCECCNTRFKSIEPSEPNG
jgi:hypothetical protein